MGQLWSIVSEYRQLIPGVRGRGEAVKKDDFYPKLRQFVEKLESFQKIDRYCTTDYRMSYATIKLGKYKDADLIAEYLNQNSRDNWTVTVEIQIE